MLLAPIIEIFCEVDDYYKQYVNQSSTYLLSNPDRIRDKPASMAGSEIMTIMILFHLSHYRTFKDFYVNCILHDPHQYFPDAVSYNRFVEIQKSVFMALTAFLISKSGKHTDLYYIDSTKLAVCHNKRINRNKVFKDIAKRGKTSMGWFFGFKLHLVINHLGEIVTFCFTKGNVNDGKMMELLLKNLKGLAAGDKGYISKAIAEKLEKQGLKFISSVRKNMKKKAMTAFERFFLSQRGLVETVIEQLKSICYIEHTRHRSPDNFMVNLISGMIAYCFKPNKPQLKLSKFQYNFFPGMSN